jgi:hypothetical protein
MPFSIARAAASFVSAGLRVVAIEASGESFD